MSITDRTDEATVEESEPDRIQDSEKTAKTWWRRFGPAVITVLNLTTFFIIWELVARAELINKAFFPTASGMFAELWTGLTTSAPPGATFSGSIRDHLLFSMTNLFVGVTISCIIGIPFGLLMGANKFVDGLLSPYVWAISSMPRIALVPLLILFFGFTRRMMIITIILSAVFPIIINSWAGVKTTEKSLLSAAKVFGASKLQLYSKVVFPYTLPFIMSGIQQGISRGMVGVIIAEIFGGSKGLGYLITRAADAFKPELLYAVLFVLVVVSLTLIQITRWAEAKVAPWRRIDAL